MNDAFHRLASIQCDNQTCDSKTGVSAACYATCYRFSSNAPDKSAALKFPEDLIPRTPGLADIGW